MIEAPMGQTRQTPHRYALHGVPYVTSSKAPCGNFVPRVVDEWHVFCSLCPAIVHARITMMHNDTRRRCELLLMCAGDLNTVDRILVDALGASLLLSADLISQRSHSSRARTLISLCRHIVRGWCRELLSPAVHLLATRVSLCAFQMRGYSGVAGSGGKRSA